MKPLFLLPLKNHRMNTTRFFLDTMELALFDYLIGKLFLLTIFLFSISLFSYCTYYRMCDNFVMYNFAKLYMMLWEIDTLSSYCPRESLISFIELYWNYCICILRDRFKYS